MMMDVPGRLPLRRLEGEVERTDAREMDAGREVGLAEEVVMTLYGIVAGVLEVHRKGRAARKDEAAADPAFLLADNVLRLRAGAGALITAGHGEALQCTR